MRVLPEIDRWAKRKWYTGAEEGKSEEMTDEDWQNIYNWVQTLSLPQELKFNGFPTQDVVDWVLSAGKLSNQSNTILSTGKVAPNMGDGELH